MKIYFLKGVAKTRVGDFDPVNKFFHEMKGKKHNSTLPHSSSVRRREMAIAPGDNCAYTSI